MGVIYLYGEIHSIQKIKDKEFELWCEYYTKSNIRHLFVESSYYNAEFLNIWMQSDNDEILDMLREDLIGTPAHSLIANEFLKAIKKECPETIFHGTDVGHQYDTTGARFIKYLEDNNLSGSEMCALVEDAIWQGKYYYTDAMDRVNRNNIYRENKMVENFIREFDKLNGQSVMGIYGALHTDLNAMDSITKTVPCMGNQLKRHYGEIVISEDLSWLARDNAPIRKETFTLNGKNYEASFFGEQSMAGFEDYVCRKVWRLENAYDDFKDAPKTGNVLPYNHYALLINTGQIFVIEYVMTDGSTSIQYHRSDGIVWNDMPATEQFTIA